MPKFEKGKSGNPRGRPPGKGTPLKLRQILERKSEDLLKKAIDDALDGDGALLRMLLDKALPAMKAKSVRVRLERFGADSEQQAARVLEMLAAGDLDAEEARAVMDVIRKRQEIVELKALETRIAALEETKE